MGRAWWATDVSPRFLTGVSSIYLLDIVCSIDDILRLNFLAEAEELFLCWQDIINIMF